MRCGVVTRTNTPLSYPRIEDRAPDPRLRPPRRQAWRGRTGRRHAQDDAAGVGVQCGERHEAQCLRARAPPLCAGRSRGHAVSVCTANAQIGSVLLCSVLFSAAVLWSSSVRRDVGSVREKKRRVWEPHWMRRVRGQKHARTTGRLGCGSGCVQDERLGLCRHANLYLTSSAKESRAWNDCFSSRLVFPCARAGLGMCVAQVGRAHHESKSTG